MSNIWAARGGTVGLSIGLNYIELHNLDLILIGMKIMPTSLSSLFVFKKVSNKIFETPGGPCCQDYIKCKNLSWI